MHKHPEVAAGTKVPRFNKFKSTILLSKITHYMLCDDTLSQRSKATRAGVGVKFRKRRVSNIRRVFRGGVVRNPLPTMHKNPSTTFLI